ncbi:MAG TPA: hypothetical protein VF821_33060 [Lentzea sp.]
MAAVALVAGCGTGESATQPAPATTTTSSAAPRTPAELDVRVKAAMAPPGAFDSLGGKLAESTPANDGDPGVEHEVVTTVCGNKNPLRVEGGTSVARTRIWAGGVSLFERVHAMSEVSADLLVRQAQNEVNSCKPYREATEITANMPIAKPEGVEDFYAHCEANKDPGTVPWSCHAVMGRGKLIAHVVASGQSQQAAAAQLTSAVPIFAAPFVKA